MLRMESKILKSLEELWKRNPNQRFGQLLINLKIVEDTPVLWNKGDNETMRNIKENETKKS